MNLLFDSIKNYAIYTVKYNHEWCQIFCLNLSRFPFWTVSTYNPHTQNTTVYIIGQAWMYPKNYPCIEVYYSLGTNTDISGANHTIYSSTTNVMIWKIPQKRPVIVLTCIALRYDTSVEAGVGLRQPILEKYSCSSVSQIDQNMTYLESYCADVLFPNFKI